VHNLLARPGPELAAVLDAVLAALAKAVPIPAGHRKDLPPAVRELSSLLTAERGGLSRSYWSAPRLASAYLYFFLPWNIFRLAWLLPGLDLSLRQGSRILDLGSGPLTLPIALWCARPDLRQTPLSFDCVDVAAKPMQYGRSVFYALAGEDSPWRMSLVRSPVEKALRLAEKEQGGYACIIAGNVLNELFTGGGSARQRPPGFLAGSLADSLSDSLADRMEELTDLAHSALLPEGRLFLLEPGNRFGGKLIALARESALGQGFAVLSPCTHEADCPMLEHSWCHFTLPAAGAPQALRELSAKARLEKNSLALSCLLLRRGIAARTTASTISGVSEIPGASEARIRVISAPIRLPGSVEPARYACCSRGLALLPNALRTPSGAFVSMPWPDKEQRDAKSGALMLKRTTLPDTRSTASNPRARDSRKA